MFYLLSSLQSPQSLLVCTCYGSGSILCGNACFDYCGSDCTKQCVSLCNNFCGTYTGCHLGGRTVPFKANSF